MIKLITMALMLTMVLGFSKTIKLTSGEWAPFTSSKLKGNGIALSVVRDVFKNADINVEYKFYPWKRAYETAKFGKADGTAVWFKNPEREKDFYFSKEPVVAHKTVFFHLKSNLFNWENFSDLKDIKIGITRGYSYGDKFDTAAKNKELKVDVANTDVQNFKKLLAGRIDVFVCEFDVGYDLLAQNFSTGDKLKITNSSKILREAYTYLLLNKKNPENKKLMETFDAELSKMKKNGKYDKYFEK